MVFSILLNQHFIAAALFFFLQLFPISWFYSLQLGCGVAIWFQTWKILVDRDRNHDMPAFVLSQSLQDHVIFVFPAQHYWPHLCIFYSSINKCLTYCPTSSIDIVKVGVAFLLANKLSCRPSLWCSVTIPFGDMRSCKKPHIFFRIQHERWWAIYTH